MAGIEIDRVHLQRRRIMMALIAGIGLASAAGALADSPSVIRSGVYRDPVDMAVVDRDTGEPLQVWRHAGRLFVAGEPGRRYAVRVTNRTGARVMVVMSVDGVNILTGQTASYSQNGYVLDPYESYDATGWRKSDTEVAAFSFASLSESYAARTGRPGDVGVIGMAVFQERPLLEPLHAEARPLPAPPPPSIRSTPAPAEAGGWVNEVVVTGSRIARQGAPSAQQEDKLGTAHGQREWSQVHTVSFIRATPYPQSVKQIEYDTYDNLVASNVIPRGGSDPRHPRAFPSQPQGGGFVPDPPDDR